MQIAIELLQIDSRTNAARWRKKERMKRKGRKEPKAFQYPPCLRLYLEMMKHGVAVVFVLPPGFAPVFAHDALVVIIASHIPNAEVGHVSHVRKLRRVRVQPRREIKGEYVAVFSGSFLPARV